MFEVLIWYSFMGGFSPVSLYLKLLMYLEIYILLNVLVSSCFSFAEIMGAGCCAYSWSSTSTCFNGLILPSSQSSISTMKPLLFEVVSQCTREARMFLHNLLSFGIYNLPSPLYQAMVVLCFFKLAFFLYANRMINHRDEAPKLLIDQLNSPVLFIIPLTIKQLGCPRTW